MTEINDISDFVRVLEENPEWLYTLQGMIISGEIAAVPAQLNRLEGKVDNLAGLEGRMDRLEGKVDGLEGRTDRLEGKVDDLTGQVEGLGRKVDNLAGRVDNLAGPTYEIKVAQQIASIAGQHLQLGAVRTAHGTGDRRDDDLTDLLDAAFEESRKKANLVNELRRCDLIISGRRRGQQEREYALFEASITVGDNDVHRAARRAAILSQLTGHPAMGVVIGSHIPPAQHALARTQGVTAITYAD